MGEGNAAHDVAAFWSVSTALTWLKERASRHRWERTANGVEIVFPAVDTEEFGLFGVLLRGSIDSIIISDRETEWFLEVSDSFEALTGYDRCELIGRTSLEVGLVDHDDLHVRTRTFARAGIGGTYETELRRSDGTRLWVEFTQQIIDDQYVLTILRNMSDRKRLEQDLRMFAEFDELTGIYNRRRFQEEVERNLLASRRFGDPLTLLLLDIDGFKQINDTYGHHTGDLALQVVARALRGAVRRTDLVGRLGGDEFVALLTRADEQGVERVIESFRRSLRLEDAASGADFTIEASIGIARAAEAEETCETLLRRADREMYAQKERAKRAVGTGAGARLGLIGGFAS